MTQEGCHFGHATQATVSKDLRNALDAAGLNDTAVAASDENTYTEARLLNRLLPHPRIRHLPHFFRPFFVHSLRPPPAPLPPPCTPCSALSLIPLRPLHPLRPFVSPPQHHVPTTLLSHFPTTPLSLVLTTPRPPLPHYTHFVFKHTHHCCTAGVVDVEIPRRRHEGSRRVGDRAWV